MLAPLLTTALLLLKLLHETPVAFELIHIPRRARHHTLVLVLVLVLLLLPLSGFAPASTSVPALLPTFRAFPPVASVPTAGASHLALHAPIELSVCVHRRGLVGTLGQLGHRAPPLRDDVAQRGAPLVGLRLGPLQRFHPPACAAVAHGVVGRASGRRVDVVGLCGRRLGFGIRVRARIGRALSIVAAIVSKHPVPHLLAGLGLSLAAVSLAACLHTVLMPLRRFLVAPSLVFLPVFGLLLPLLLVMLAVGLVQHPDAKHNAAVCRVRDGKSMCTRPFVI